MRAMIMRGAALVVALGLSAATRGDEPTRPTAPATEANPAVPAAGHSVHGEAFNDGPRQHATLLPGMGKASFPVTTSRPEAQAFINQGVAQLHSFYYFESERSFRQAATIDPDCAMAYWGMAMSNVNNPKRARAFLKEARKRDAKLSRRETLYLDALEALYKDGEGRQGPQAGPPARPGGDRPGVPRGHRRPRLAGDGHLAERVDHQPAVGRHRARHRARRRADAPRRAPLPHPPVGRRQAGPGREVGRRLRGDGPRHRARLAHARPHLHRAEAVRRRRLPAGGLGPRRPRRDGPRPDHAVRDPQLRAQQPVALHQPEPRRPRPRRHRRGPQPRRAAPRPEPERHRTTAARRSGAGGSAGPRS